MLPVCRALGIPSRPVSGYNAAHDSQGSLTIDIIKDDNGETLDSFTNDSVWNYHVWNEVIILKQINEDESVVSAYLFAEYAHRYISLVFMMQIFVT